MKIGLSFSRCVVDIAAGKIDLDDVLVIIARTRMDTISAMRETLAIYERDGAFANVDYFHCVQIAESLWAKGKLHQPRLFTGTIGIGVHPDFVWLDAFPTAIGDNPMIKGAWETYRVALAMGEAIPSKESLTKQDF